MRTLVSGRTGTVGKEVVKRLLAIEENVFIMTRDAAPHHPVGEARGCSQVHGPGMGVSPTFFSRTSDCAATAASQHWSRLIAYPACADLREVAGWRSPATPRRSKQTRLKERREEQP